MRFPSVTEFKDKATAAYRRFPVTLTWAVLGSFAIIGLLNAEDDKLLQRYSDLILTLILGISWLISSQFFTEQFKKPIKLWWIKVIVITFLVAIYIYLPAEEQDKNNIIPYTRYALYLIAGHLFVMCSPFFMSWNDGAYYNYLKNMILAIARSGVFSGVLFLGLVLALVAIQFLFEYKFEGVRFAQLFVFCLGIVNTWVYLSDFPKNIQFNLRLSYFKATSVFVKFILIPLAALYIVILYAYAIKILVRWQLPEGWVSYLIIALSGLIFLIQFIIHPVRHTHESRIIRRFTPFCYYLLLPLLPLLYTAIYRRVADYGITEKRYFLIVLACFITVSAIYLLWSRKKQLRFLPISLFALILLTSVGPWGAFSVSENSQLDQMQKAVNAFAKAKKEQTQKSVDTAQISQEQFHHFRSITSYLYDRDKLAEAKEFLGYDPVKKFDNANGYSISDSIIKQMGIEVKERSNYPGGTINYYTDNAESLDIKGFDQMKDLYISKAKEDEIRIYEDYGLKYNKGTTAVEIIKNGAITLSIPLNDFLNRLESHYGTNNSQVDNKEMRLDAENASIKIRFIFKRISFIPETNTGENKFDHGNLILLLKIKNNAE